mmetsp:Transcript_1119/g.1550  ORF Transcript_1119/g.1550 Transcript_1119/m.1550 type:complete len:118 (+) Transcript_1119:92-445(+)
MEIFLDALPMTRTPSSGSSGDETECVKTKKRVSFEFFVEDLETSSVSGGSESEKATPSIVYGNAMTEGSLGVRKDRRAGRGRKDPHRFRSLCSASSPTRSRIVAAVSGHVDPISAPA